MKIERMNKNSVVFDDAAPGTVFEYFDIVYMKTQQITKTAINAVILSNGACAFFLGNEEITLVDAKLVIK